jgi:hypothetical protein
LPAAALQALRTLETGDAGAAEIARARAGGPAHKCTTWRARIRLAALRAALQASSPSLGRPRRHL